MNTILEFPEGLVYRIYGTGFLKLSQSEIESIIKIIIPKGVKYIGGFAQYKNLEEILLPESLEGIGKNAFRNCTQLRRIILPPNLKIIDDGAFYGCTALQSVSLPKDLAKIGDDVFHGCYNLEDMTIPDCCDCGKHLFVDCANLKTMSLPYDMLFSDDDIYGINPYVKVQRCKSKSPKVRLESTRLSVIGCQLRFVADNSFVEIKSKPDDLSIENIIRDIVDEQIEINKEINL